MNQYFGMVTSPTFVPHVPAMTTVPISLRLREHHCINPEQPIQSGGLNTDILDDGITNAWFPSDVNIRESSDGVRIENARNGGSSSRYERYREGKGNSHNEETCRQCRYKNRQEQLDLEERIRRNKRASEERDETVDQHIDDSDGSHSSDDTADFPFQPRHSALKYVAHRPHDQNINVPTIGVTRPDGPSSGVDPEADIRREFSQALGRDVDEMLDEEMGDAEEMEDDVSEWDEYVENTCNGIQDIIITGEVSHSYHNYILKHGSSFCTDCSQSWPSLAALSLLRPCSSMGWTRRPCSQACVRPRARDRYLPWLPCCQSELCWQLACVHGQCSCHTS
jgi:hypothetical protein